MTGATTGILQCNPPSKREEIPHRPQAVDDGSAKTAVFALQKIQFSNDRFWRKADIRVWLDQLLCPLGDLDGQYT